MQVKEMLGEQLDKLISHMETIIITSTTINGSTVLSLLYDVR